MSQPSMAGSGRMVMLLLEIRTEEEERVVGEVWIAELFTVISKVISLLAVCAPSSSPSAASRIVTVKHSPEQLLHNKIFAVALHCLMQ